MKIKRIIMLFASIFMMLTLAACSGGDKVSDFEFINQDNEPFGLKDLKGEAWLADFIFTNCDTVCPPMTANMSRIQSKLQDEGIDITIVSFSVDPEVDTPEMLKEFSKKFDADLSSWHFLTGYSYEEIKSFAQKDFKTLVQKPDNSDQVIHGTTFYLINKKGEIVNSYSGLEQVPYDQIVNDVKALVNE